MAGPVVLYIDSSRPKILRSTFELLKHNYGVDAILARSIQDAEKVVGSRKIDFIISDIVLRDHAPDVVGEFLDRQLEHRTPVIISTLTPSYTADLVAKYREKDGLFVLSGILGIKGIGEKISLALKLAAERKGRLVAPGKKPIGKDVRLRKETPKRVIRKPTTFRPR